MIERTIEVTPPYRLDLTVAVLQRFSTNIVDVSTSDGTYVRALGGPAAPAFLAVRQSGPTTLVVRFEGFDADAARDFALVRRILGTERTTPLFDRRAQRLPWLRELAHSVRGVRTPRYATLWEACVNAIVFQAVSLHAATAVLRRAIVALGEPVTFEDRLLYAFPSAEDFARASTETLRGAGLSAAKAATLQRVAGALLAGTLDEAMLEERSTDDASALLCTIKGIGPWTAAVVLLRGLARLDIFPMNDSGVARTVTVFGGPDVDLEATLRALGSERGMLYYHLLLARLIAAGEIDPSAKACP